MIKLKNMKRIKLNMLEPGTKMLTASGVLLLIAMVLYIARWQTAAIIFGAGAAVLLVLLFILVKIELYQDKQDYLRYKDETKK